MNLIGKIPESWYTHVFRWNDKECLVGKFDPETEMKLDNKEFSQLGTELMQQIEASKMFTTEELENIAMLPSDVFLELITPQ